MDFDVERAISLTYVGITTAVVLLAFLMVVIIVMEKLVTRHQRRLELSLSPEVAENDGAEDEKIAAAIGLSLAMVENQTATRVNSGLKQSLSNTSLSIGSHWKQYGRLGQMFSRSGNKKGWS